MRLLFKNSIKKILKSFGRFISISIIILIGISVFIGLREATPGMLYTSDNYYDAHNLMDLKIVSNYGLNEDDIKALEELENVSKVIPSYSVDILSKGKSIRVHSIEDEVNNVYLIEGKMPENDNECLGDYHNYKIGDKIVLDEENEYLNTKEYEVVGTIKSVLYINKDYGISNVGDGKLSSFIFVPKSVFNCEYYTEGYIIAKDTKELHSYKDEYKETIDKLKEEINIIKENRENTRYEEIKKQAEDEIQELEKSLQTGYIQYNANANEYEQIYKTIEDAKKEIEEIEKPIWHVLDRNDNVGYQNYKDDTLKVEAISEVLPVFFVIVVMLMCLNTLTRLIEEERTEIGILQSNGFSKASIILSYLYYVFTSTIIGLGIGLTVGYTIVSKIIYNVFTSNYYLQDYIGTVDIVSLLVIIFGTLALMMIVTIIACNKELKEKPADLLRPKPPKSGKKIFLERFHKTWAKLSFMSKVTARNLFRYKKRIVMTILGVAGCTALLLTGFGLNDSINIISKVQYNDIVKYDSMVVLKEEINEVPSKIKELFTDNNINEYLLVNQNAYTYSYDNKEESAYLVVPQNSEELNKYITLKSTIIDEEIGINDDGVIISSQMAEQLSVTKGDNIIIKNSDKETFELRVNDIVYNYVSHYIYISNTYYKEVFGGDIKYNNIITNGYLDKNIELSDYGIYMINDTNDIIDTFDTFIKSINGIIILIIVCACLLAFAVLYNLTIINVNERKREIATFKVLGFNDKEIFIFIYRETFILSILGTLLGLILGIFLHRFIITTAQTGNILFMYNIEWYSYLLAATITVIFSLLVQLLINRTLKKIDMIDSLKSVE